MSVKVLWGISLNSAQKEIWCSKKALHQLEIYCSKYIKHCVSFPSIPNHDNAGQCTENKNHKDRSVAYNFCVAPS